MPDDIVSTVRPALLVLFAAVLMVLLVACGNLINLLLARNAAREQEFAIRRALGASAARLTRRLLVESAMLGVAGAICGTVLARLSLTALSRFGAGAVPRIDAIHIDRPALLFAACLAVVATFSPANDVVYRPFAQQAHPAPFLVVRTAGDPDDFAPTLRRAIAAADKWTAGWTA